MTNAHTAQSVRADFLRFFEEHGHRVVPSGPVFPQDDPTLLFTNAGMNQFKDVFLGTGKRDYARAADTQKCIRVSGKHNDLEEVGVDTYHHTFFEMLGNWSFGDYFKEDAIPWAWELLTEVWGLPKDRLWVTVFAGDEGDGLPADEEAERIWREKTDIDPSRILRAGKADNFWEMGETGPCGPCSEIHIDRGAEDEDRADGADPAIGVNAGNERFIELWNLVFMQFNRLDDRSLRALPAQHVDTGMGFERILSVLQGVRSNYDTDLFGPLFARLEELSGRTYGRTDSRSDVAFRVCADHVRAVSIAVSDGALPSNTGRGYVLRRLIRRAARYGRQELGLEEPFLCGMVATVAEVLGDAFGELRERAEHIELIVREEEVSFARTLGRGLIRFEELAARVTGGGATELPGAEAFELYATYGFPLDLVELMARERELTLDTAGWEGAEEKHRNASKSEGSFTQLLSAEELEGAGSCVPTFHGEGERAHRVATRVGFGAERADARIALVLAETPFYAESGGQAADTGEVRAADGSFTVAVEDVQKAGEVVVHLGKLSAGTAPGAWAGVEVVAEVDNARRALTRKNHTGTHLLHRALKLVLGDHVVQQGSYVGPDRLRFDFSHPRGVTPEELDRIEELVNEQVFANAPVVTTEEDLEAAKERGVTAVFGEKYGERVRVLDVGGWSTELCGGTHVAAAGDIGPFVILTERAISAGVRRIEGLTGPAAVAEVQRQRRVLRETAQVLKASADEVPARVEQLQKQLKEAKKKQKAGSAADVGSALKRVEDALVETGSARTAVVDLPELDQEALRDLAGRAKGLAEDLVVVLFGRDGKRVPFLVVSQGAPLAAGLKAGDLAKVAGGVLGGGGGGRPELAQGQGSRPDAVGEARSAVQGRLEEVLAAD
jgi:alanyl-tRNA synthetase